MQSAILKIDRSLVWPIAGTVHTGIITLGRYQDKIHYYYRYIQILYEYYPTNDLWEGYECIQKFKFFHFSFKVACMWICNCLYIKSCAVTYCMFVCVWMCVRAYAVHMSMAVFCVVCIMHVCKFCCIQVCVCVCCVCLCVCVNACMRVCMCVCLCDFELLISTTVMSFKIDVWATIHIITHTLHLSLFPSMRDYRCWQFYQCSVHYVTSMIINFYHNDSIILFLLLDLVCCCG